MSEEDPIIKARGLSKHYGSFEALKDISFTLPPGRILGIFGANGAGKTTLLNALLGLHSYSGELAVLGLDPYADRAKLMRDVSFISDVATLPRWMQVRDVLRYVEDVHPNFDRAKAEDRLRAQTNVKPRHRIKNLSKGMTVQLHLSIMLAIDSKLLVLDEPTIGLDILHRRSFYDALITEFFDHQRSIIITTHQMDEIDQIISHALFIKNGEIILDAALDDLGARFKVVDVKADQQDAAAALGPIFKQPMIGYTRFIFDGIDKTTLSPLGEIRRASVTDLFIAKMQPVEAKGELPGGYAQ
ncbi:MAG: ABC transporter ATP-binding protein [Pseudomonadota bacterium]